MARKQIQAFNISFLDLLSGALGAVILLFIIVPKIDSKTQAELEVLDQVNVEIEELRDMLEQAINSIPTEVYEQIQEQMMTLVNTVETLAEEIEVLQNQLSEATERIEELETQNQQQQEQIESMQQQLHDLLQQVKKCEDDMEKMEGEEKFAVITMSWETRGDDVDMHIIDPSGAEFYYSRTTNPGRPGKLTKDDTKGPGVEVWQIASLEPGTYQIKANLYKSVSGIAPNLEFWVYYRNGNKSFRKTLYRESVKTLITTMDVDTDGNVTLY